MPTSLNLLALFSNDPSGFGPTQTLDMTQPAFANTLAAYKTTHQQALIGFLSDIANSSINKDEFYNRFIFAYLTTILEAGLTPDPTNWTQQIDAIKAFAEKANIHDSTKTYKQGARVQNGLGGDWYEAVQDVTAGEALTNNPLFWLPSSNFKIFNSDDVLTTGRALTVNDINKHLVFGGSSYQTFTLPLANSVPSGSMIFVKGRKDFRATFNRQGSDTINIDSGSGFTSCSCIAPESIILVSNGNGVWRLTKINPFYNATAFTAPDRAANTNYTNSSPFPIRVIINVNMGGAGSSIVLNGASSHVKPFTILNSTFSIESWFYPGETYQLSTTGTVTIFSWFEYAVTI